MWMIHFSSKQRYHFVMPSPEDNVLPQIDSVPITDQRHLVLAFRPAAVKPLRPGPICWASPWS